MSKASSQSANAPECLTGAARQWWLDMVETYGFEDEPHCLQLLTNAAVQLQRMESAREVLDQEGLTYRDRFGQPKERPESTIERAAGNLFRLLCRELAIDPPDEESIRVPRGR